MKARYQDFLICLFLLVLSFSFWLFYLETEPVFLSNPDSAKFAEVAKNIKNGNGFRINYSPCKKEIIDDSCFVSVLPPFYPIVISLFMRVFGENDKAVIYTSGFFYILSVLLIYFLAKKIFNRQIAFFSALVLVFCEQFLFHSISGTAETLFTFLLLLNIIFILNKSVLFLLLAAIFSVLLSLTKIQAIIYIPFLLIFIFFTRKKEKNWSFLIYLILIIIFSFPLKELKTENLIDTFFYFFNKKTLTYFLLYNSPAFPSGSLDQTNYLSLSLFPFLKSVLLKIFINFYNAFKTILTVTNPFIMVLFFLSFLKKEKKEIFILKILTLFLFLFFIFSGALGIFNIRYSHPVLPLIIIFAIAMLVELINNSEFKKKSLILSLYFLIFFFLFSLTQINLGVKILKKDKNIGKPSIYYLMGREVKKISGRNEIIATNLEIWGSWYGQRKTILIPYEIKDLPEVDTVYLTSFSPGTEPGREWQELINNPKDFNGYKFLKKIVFPAASNYQNIPVKAVVFKKITNYKFQIPNKSIKNSKLQIPNSK